MVTGWYKAPPEETTSFCVPCHGGTFCSGGTQPLWKGAGWDTCWGKDDSLAWSLRDS